MPELLSTDSDKDFHLWLSQWDGSGATSFFDLSVDHDQDSFNSSGPTVEPTFFDEIDLGTVSAEASDFSTTTAHPTTCSLSACLADSAAIARGSRLRSSAATSIPAVPRSQKLVHRLRPDGATISGADLLSLENGVSTLPGAAIRPSASLPTLSPAEISPSTHPRAPQERAPRTPHRPSRSVSSINESVTNRGQQGVCKRIMQPSNYYTNHHGASSSLEGRPKSIITYSDSVGAPLSPPPSIKVEQRSLRADRFALPYRERRHLLDSPGPNNGPEVSLASQVSPMGSCRQVPPLMKQETGTLPLSPWGVEDPSRMVLPLISPPPYDAALWQAVNRAEYMQNPIYEPVFEPVDQSPPLNGSLEQQGLIIDFCHCGRPLDQIPAAPTQAFSYDDGLFAAAVSTPSQQHQQLEHMQREAAGFSVLDFSFAQDPLPSPSPSPTLRAASRKGHRRRAGTHCRSISHDHAAAGAGTATNGTSNSMAKARSQSRQRRRQGHQRTSSTPNANSRTSISISNNNNNNNNNNNTAAEAIQTPIATMATTTTSTPAKAAATGDGVPQGDDSSNGFVNFTPSDSRLILTGVAPSGSSKTKARREREALERRRRLSEAAKRAVREAGGDWERLAGELVEV